MKRKECDAVCCLSEIMKLDYWQNILGLNDWTIRLHTNCNAEYTGYNVAETEWDEVHKAAVIRIINPSQYGKRMIPFNFEKTLVHELLHIKFALFDGCGGFQDRYLHQIIDEFARILTALENKK